MAQTTLRAQLVAALKFLTCIISHDNSDQILLDFE